MRILFGNWKYLFANFWYVLPFAIVPSIFFALTLDYGAATGFAAAFIGGNPRADFLQLFRVWSIFRVDNILGVIYSLFALISVVVFATFILVFVEKHMRIGKRTLGGVGTQFGRTWLPVLCMSLLFLAIYELWAVVLSAVMFAISAIKVTAIVYVGFIFVFLLLSFVLLYLIAIFFLWLPCVQITGFKPYNAFVYSYRLVLSVRWKLIASLAISFTAMFTVLCCCALLPEYIFRVVAFILFLLIFPAFCVRMLTVYYETDRLDREDVIRSYREM